MSSRPNRELEQARRQWAAVATSYLTTLADLVAALRAAFELASSVDEESGLASEVIAASDAVANWLAGSRPPRGLAKAEAELAAAAGVFRNAAFAFRSLSEEGEPNQQSVRAAACAAMLTQGDEHARAFAKAVQKKVPST